MVLHIMEIIETDAYIDAGPTSNESGNGSFKTLPLDMQFNGGHRMAIIMYLLLMLVSVPGNIYMLYSTTTRLKRQRRSLGRRMNLLLLNLAVADLAVTLVMMPLEVGWNATVSWRAGDYACRLFSFFRIFGIYLSGFVLICICVDRYFAVMKPFDNFDAESRVKKLLTCAWICSIIFSLPQRHPDFQWYEQCVTFNSFPSEKYELAYNMFGFCLMYAVPMATMILCYSCILFKMYTTANKKKNANRKIRASVTSCIYRAKTKTLKMAIITSLAFCICWSPYNVISLWYWFGKNSAMKLDQRIQKGLFVFACANSCFNPMIYGWYNVGSDL